MLRSPRKYNDIDGFYVMEQRVPHHYTKYIYTIIEVDGAPIAEYPKYSVDIEQLLLSLENSGRYNILETGRGFSAELDVLPDPIEVTHHGEHVSWRVGKPGLERIFHFEKDAYEAFVYQMRDQLLQIVEQYHEEMHNSSIEMVSWSYDSWAFLKPLLIKYRIW